MRCSVVPLDPPLRRARAAALAAALAAISPLASAQGLESAIQACRGIADAPARLACYDAIGTGRPASPAAAPTAAPVAAAVTAAPSARVAAAPVAAAAVAGPVAAPAPAAERFGLPERPVVAEVQAIASRVGDDFFGWGPNDRIRLANGQVWQVVDGSRGAIRPKNRNVVVRRGALGSFFMEFEGLNSTPKVRRVE